MLGYMHCRTAEWPARKGDRAMYQIQATFMEETSVVAAEYDTALAALPMACELTNDGYKVEIVGKHEEAWID